MLKKIVLGSTVCLTLLAAATASAFEFGKPITTKVTMTGKSSLSSTPQMKEVTLMNIQLTPKERQMLLSYQPKSHDLKTYNAKVPSQVNLGMNDVPVLDQGYHGTCVTFAVTAALDALLKKGDYISQLCTLELGSYLEGKSYMPSGWWGSFGPWVIDQIARFGVISKDKQTKQSCAGVKEYPTTNFFDQGEIMSVGEYKHMSEDVSNFFYPIYHMSFIDRFMTKFNDQDQAEKVLHTVKTALNNGHRLTFGTFLVLTPYCNAGACATHQKSNDTWALTKDLETPPYGVGGHEMVIFGYDDQATAVDKEGKKHKGLLLIRNSWGAEVGDGGNFYMTYDYFKKFAGEVQEFAEPKNLN